MKVRPQNRCLICWNGTEPIHKLAASIHIEWTRQQIYRDSFRVYSLRKFFSLSSSSLESLSAAGIKFPRFHRGSFNCEWQRMHFISKLCEHWITASRWNHLLQVMRIFFSELMRCQTSPSIIDSATTSKKYHSPFHVLQMHEFKHAAYVIEHIKNDENVTKGRSVLNTVCLKWNWTNTTKPNGFDNIINGVWNALSISIDVHTNERSPRSLDSVGSHSVVLSFFSLVHIITLTISLTPVNC